MKPIDFPQQTYVIAKDQPEYLPLPAHCGEDYLTFCWGLTIRERLQIVLTGKIWHQVLHCGQRLQPQKLSVSNPL